MGVDAKIIWYPTYIGDFLSVTALMSPHEVCAYTLIITHLWNAGGALPADDAKLARITNLTPDEWQAAKPTLWPLFKIKSGTLTHAATTDGIEKARTKLDQASRAGKASAASRRKKKVAVNETATDVSTDVKRPFNGCSNETATGEATGRPTEGATKHPTKHPTKRQPHASDCISTFPEGGLQRDTYPWSDSADEPFGPIGGDA